MTNSPIGPTPDAGAYSGWCREKRCEACTWVDCQHPCHAEDVADPLDCSCHPADDDSGHCIAARAYRRERPMSDLDMYYQEARETAREIVTLIKVAEEQRTDPDALIIRGVVREKVREHTPLQTWLLVEVLARAVAATYDDLADWSSSVLKAVAEGEGT